MANITKLMYHSKMEVIRLKFCQVLKSITFAIKTSGLEEACHNYLLSDSCTLFQVLCLHFLKRFPYFEFENLRMQTKTFFIREAKLTKGREGVTGTPGPPGYALAKFSDT